MVLPLDGIALVIRGWGISRAPHDEIAGALIERRRSTADHDLASAHTTLFRYENVDFDSAFLSFAKCLSRVVVSAKKGLRLNEQQANGENAHS
jgi:hypothetical protein